MLTITDVEYGDDGEEVSERRTRLRALVRFPAPTASSEDNGKKDLYAGKGAAAAERVRDAIVEALLARGVKSVTFNNQHGTLES